MSTSLRYSIERVLPILVSRKLRSQKNIRKEGFDIKSYSTSGSGHERVPLTSSNLDSTNRALNVTGIFNMNIDEKDVNRHENLAADWWDPRGPMMGLHAMNDIRISLIRNGLENSGILKAEDIKTNPKYFTGTKILEVGCGAGILCEPLTRLGADVTGIDPSDTLVTIAKNHAAENAETLKSAPTYINTNIEDHSSSIHSIYDVVVASEVIEHVPNKELFLESCIKTLKPGGSIFFTTPNRTTLSWLASIVIAENVLKLLPKGIHSWDQFVTPLELKQILEKLGCKTVLINGMIFNPLTYSWSWSSSTNLHYAVHAIKTNLTVTGPASAH